jgi:hypothetical protein
MRVRRVAPASDAVLPADAELFDEVLPRTNILERVFSSNQPFIHPQMVGKYDGELTTQIVLHGGIRLWHRSGREVREFHELQGFRVVGGGERARFAKVVAEGEERAERGAFQVDDRHRG